MDNQFTQRLTDWLNTPREQQDITAGATMLLQLNRNRFLYANILRRPDKMYDKLVYELRKHLRIRQDNLTLRDLAQMEAQVIPAARQTLDNPPAISTDDEFPEAKVARGRRPDHDRLPAHIQALWDENLHHYKVIKQVFEQLKTMENAEPCDRYEYLKILDEADRKYRAKLEKYDAYVIGSEPDVDTTKPATDAEARRKVNAARKTLTKYKAILRRSLQQGNATIADTAKGKILDCVNTIRAAGHAVGEAVTAELLELDIDINA